MVNNLYVVTPRGFCAGVEMAIKALTWMLKIYDEPVYCYHEIVHNDWICLLYTSPSPRDVEESRMPSSA